MAPRSAMSALQVAAASGGVKSEDAPQTSLTPASDEEMDRPKALPAPLPFSVEALMSDRKPSRDALASDGTAAGTSQTPSPRIASGLLKMSEDALVKSEATERQERSPWMQDSRFSPPPSKTDESSCLHSQK
uniref:Homeobox protein MSX-1-like n=1 Tax=Callorhinchus milii TaxID=7868 RepID=A0A4W3GCA7_CALMI